MAVGTPATSDHFSRVQAHQHNDQYVSWYYLPHNHAYNSQHVTQYHTQQQQQQYNSLTCVPVTR